MYIFFTIFNRYSDIITVTPPFILVQIYTFIKLPGKVAWFPSIGFKSNAYKINFKILKFYLPGKISNTATAIIFPSKNKDRKLIF